jgi:hypothetical protein
LGRCELPFDVTDYTSVLAQRQHLLNALPALLYPQAKLRSTLIDSWFDSSESKNNTVKRLASQGNLACKWPSPSHGVEEG